MHLGLDFCIISLKWINTCSFKGIHHQCMYVCMYVYAFFLKLPQCLKVVPLKSMYYLQKCVVFDSEMQFLVAFGNLQSMLMN